MNREDMVIRGWMFVALLLSTRGIYWVVIEHDYFFIPLVALNGVSIWFGLETLRLRRIRRKTERKHE